MQYKTARTLLSTLALVSLPALAAPPAAEPVQIQLTCGGIGSDESAQMLADTPKHALTILFVSHDGHYMSDVQTRVETAKGEGAAEQSCGPVGQVDVDRKGRYRIKASFAGKQQEKLMDLKPMGGKRIVLNWKVD